MRFRPSSFAFGLTVLLALALTACSVVDRRGGSSTPSVQPDLAATAALATSVPTASAAPTETSASPLASEARPRPASGKEAVYLSIEQSVARLRGLKPTRDVELRYLSPPELREFFLSSFDREYSPEERARDQKLLVGLGLIRPEDDLASIMLNLLSSEVIGLYDEQGQRMYLIGDAGEPNADSKVTFSHEYTHALQDMHFDLKALNPPDSDNDDRSAAIQALVEGDATLLMLLYAQNDLTSRERREWGQSQRGPSTFESAPLVLRVELLFPYSEGLRFVQQLYRQGGFAAVDAAFRDRPRSTEQILHFEKYVAREAPIEIVLPDLPAALGGNWRQTVTNTLGELDLRILVEQFSDASTGERAAAGWGGDRYAMLEDDSGRSAIVFKTAWDTAQDAHEFFTAYRDALRMRFGPNARVLARDPIREELATAGYATSVVLRGSDVLVVLAPDEPEMRRLAQGLAGG